MIRFISHNAAQTEKFGRDLGSRLKSGDFIAMYGPMGTGKTTFINGLADGLGIVDYVSSPTFALVHEYSGPIPLYHFDMYRVNSWEDLYSTAFYEYLNSSGVIVVEWSENIESALPDKYIKVEISFTGGKYFRQIIITEVHKHENSCD